MGHKGMDCCFFPIEKICYFFLENKASYLHTFDGESWLVDLSLRAIEKDIREVDFFRLHRQLIIHRKTIKKFVRWQGGRLKMILIPKLPGQLRSRSEEHTSELQSLMRNSYAVFCLKKKK